MQEHTTATPRWDLFIYVCTAFIALAAAIIIGFTYPAPFSFIDDPISDFGGRYADNGDPNLIASLTMTGMFICLSAIFCLGIWFHRQMAIYNSAVYYVDVVLCIGIVIGFVMASVPLDVHSDIHRFGGFLAVNALMVYTAMRLIELWKVHRSRIALIVLWILIGMFTLFYTNYALEFIEKEKFMQNISITITILAFFTVPWIAYAYPDPFPLGYYETPDQCNAHGNTWHTRHQICVYKKNKTR